MKKVLIQVGLIVFGWAQMWVDFYILSKIIRPPISWYEIPTVVTMFLIFGGTITAYAKYVEGKEKQG